MTLIEVKNKDELDQIKEYENFHNVLHYKFNKNDAFIIIKSRIFMIREYISIGKGHAYLFWYFQKD